jgi:hypothetical protein
LGRALYVLPEGPSRPTGIRHGTGLFVLNLTSDRIRTFTRFDKSVLPWFGLPRSLPSRYAGLADVPAEAIGSEVQPLTGHG